MEYLLSKERSHLCLLAFELDAMALPEALRASIGASAMNAAAVREIFLSIDLKSDWSLPFRH